MRRHDLAVGLLAWVPLAAAPNTYHETSAIWQHTKRCDMLEHATELNVHKGFTTLRGGWQFPYPAYTAGSWIPSTPHQPSVTGCAFGHHMRGDRTRVQRSPRPPPCGRRSLQSAAARLNAHDSFRPLVLCADVPLACDAASVCPQGSPGCEGSAQSKSVCARFHTTCYADRRSTTFQQNVGTLRYTWQPSNGCRFSPAAPVAEWYEWAKAREADAGSMLFVGDSTLASLFVAFQQLTSGAANSDFLRADTLVNSWSLAPMTPAQTASCVSTSGASSGVATVPCPPSARSSTLWWEDNTHHQLKNVQWTTAFEARAASLKRLVLSVGSEWWQQYNYISSPNGCARASGGGSGTADAFKPLTSLGLPNHEYEAVWRACDPFEVKYPIWVTNLAQYLNSVSAFTGQVIFVTQPPGQRGCETVSAPNAAPATGVRGEADIKKPSFWYEGNPTGTIGDGVGGQHAFGKLKHAERAWAQAFSKHAPRLRLSVLNITAMSEGRSDARVRDGACGSFCYPGVPHHWAEMLIRLLEQQVYGGTDGLYDRTGLPGR